MQTIGSTMRNAAFEAAKGKASMDGWLAQGRPRPIVWFFFAACGVSIVLGLVEQWLFSDEERRFSELCAFGAFAAAAATSLRKRRHAGGSRAPRVGPRHCDESTVAVTVAVDNDPAPQRRTRRPLPRPGLVGNMQRRGTAGQVGSDAGDEGGCRKVDAALVEGIADACRAGTTALAESRLEQLLGPAVVTEDAAAAGDTALRTRLSVGGAGAGSHVHAIVEACLEAGDAKLAAAWLPRLHAAGLRAGPRTLLAVLEALVEGRCGAQAEDLIVQMLAVGAPLDGACYQQLFQHCIPADDSARIEAWLQRLAARSSQEHTQGYVALLRARAQAGDAERAELWMNHAIEAGAARSSHLYNAVIHACARASDIKRAEWWLERMVQASAAIDARVKSGESCEQRLAPDVISYSAIMDACAQHGETERAEAWFKRMTDAGIAPDTVSFNTVIKAYARGGDISGAERWLRHARETGTRLDAFGYNAVIAAAARSADPEKAEKWLRQMLQDGAEPDVVSYNSVINAWAKHGDAAGAHRLVNLMCENGVEPDVVTLGVSVHACARAGDLRLAEAIFSQIVGRGKTRPDAIGYNALINAAVKAGDTARAEHWLGSMLKDGVPPSVVSYTTVLHAHARSGDIEAAERGLEKMLEEGVEANVVSYSALIHACAKAGDVARAEKWFEHMRSKGIQANAVSYSVLLNVCAKAGDVTRAERWLETMYADGVTPNVVCYNNVIDACAKAGRSDRAETWLRRLSGEEPGPGGKEVGPGLAPTRQSYTPAAQAHATHGAWSDVERLLDEMEARGITMDEFSLTVLLSAYSRARPRQRERAETAFQRYTARGLPITRPPLRVLRSVVGGGRFEKLLAETGVKIPQGEGAL